VTTRFSVRGVMRSPPCFLHPPPPPEIPPEPGTLPLQLSAIAHWADLDPLAPTDLAAYIDLSKLVGLPAYFGRSAGDEAWLEVSLERTDPTGYWKVTFDIYDPWRHPDTWVWDNVWVDPTKPFDTGLLQDPFIPGFDFRELMILE